MPKSTLKKLATVAARSDTQILSEGLGHGKEVATAALARRGKALAVAGNQGLLIAEGDSWFDYPGDDVLAILERRFSYRVESVAHHGDTVESMAYDPTQLKKLVRTFEHVKQDGRVPRAILLSGGGNDIVGDEFAVLLNHARSGLKPLNQKVVEGILGERLRFAIASLIGTVTELSQRLFEKKVPIFLHGYARAVPDGRGFLGGFWVLPGPWMRPGFAAKAYDVDGDNRDIVQDLIDRFNALLASIAGAAGFEHVTYVDVRPLLSNQLPSAYLKDWANELHPTDPAFGRVAEAFHRAIQLRAPMPPGAGAAKGPEKSTTRTSSSDIGPAAPPRRTGRAVKARREVSK